MTCLSYLRFESDCVNECRNPFYFKVKVDALLLTLLGLSFRLFILQLQGCAVQDRTCYCETDGSPKPVPQEESNHRNQTQYKSVCKSSTFTQKNLNSYKFEQFGLWHKQHLTSDLGLFSKHKDVGRLHMSDICLAEELTVLLGPKLSDL